MCAEWFHTVLNPVRLQAVTLLSQSHLAGVLVDYAVPRTLSFFLECECSVNWSQYLDLSFLTVRQTDSQLWQSDSLCSRHPYLLTLLSFVILLTEDLLLFYYKFRDGWDMCIVRRWVHKGINRELERTYRREYVDIYLEGHVFGTSTMEAVFYTN